MSHFAAPKSIWATVFAAAVLACAVVASPNYRPGPEPRPGPFAGDFLQEYLGGHIVLGGDRSRFYDRAYATELQHDPAVVGHAFDADRYLPVVYPPFYYLLVSPLALLPYHVAAFVWAGLMAACFAAAVVILAKTRPEFAARLAWALPAAVLFAPLLENLGSGQKGTLALLILTGTFALCQRGRPFAAGLVFGLLAFKPQLTLVIGAAMLFKRQWRFVAGGVVAGVVLVGLSLAVGIDVCGQYVRVSRSMGGYIDTPGFPHEKMHCWYGFVRLLLDSCPLGVIQAVTGVAALATLAVLVRLLRGRLAVDRPAFAVQFAGLVVATVLLSPHLLTYDLTILLLPMALLVGTEVRVAGLLVTTYAVVGVSAAVALRTNVQLSVPVMAGLLGYLPRVLAMDRSAGLTEAGYSDAPVAGAYDAGFARPFRDTLTLAR